MQRNPSNPATTGPRSANNRGAALLVAVGILTVLLALGLTFYATTRHEMRRAVSVERGMRARLAADSGLAMAIGFLNEDQQTHPTYTSPDHAWKTYFNGAWMAGKPWAIQDEFLLQEDSPFAAGGVPEIPHEFIRDPAIYPFELPDNVPAEFEENLDRHWLYIPRVQRALADPDDGLEDPYSGEFVMPADYVDSWVDPVTGE
ncbi:MAG: pilus assembly PilX N-terminal domain-containing protein, partial [Candidatus Hydrogenedentota bacterium]